MKNNISTQSYLIKRLRDNGYVVWKIMDAYNEGDHRKFTIMIEPHNASIYCTCLENYEEIGDVWFEFYDSNQYCKGNIKLKTDSFETFMQHLYDRNILGTY